MKDLKESEEPKKKLKKFEMEEEEELTVPFLVYFKAFFLIGVIVFGMLILNNVSQRQKNVNSKEQDETTIATIENLKKAVTKENIEKTISEEMKTNKLYNTAVKEIEEGRDVVLGEATKAAEVVVEKSKDTIFDYLYEHTVGTLMERFIEQMPEDQKKKLIEKVEE